ncbi:MAG: family 16 glycoside hydrolase [Gemmatimonadales bacterium]
MIVALWLALQTPTLVGRWDLAVTQERDRYPSWFEIIAERDSLVGRFQGRFGHATPLARIETGGGRFRMIWPNEGDPSAPPTIVEGEWRDPNTVIGTVSHPKEAVARFTGTRAPRLDRSFEPRFGPAIDLLAEGLGRWTVREGEQNGWRLEGGVLSNRPPSSDLISRQRFTDFRLQVEVNVPPGGNSGIYLRGRHEVQVQDDFGKPPHSRRMGGIYGQVTPRTMPARPAGEWQAFDITLVGRRVTIVLNGVTMVDGAEIPGITGGALDSDEGAPGPLMLQGDHSGVQFRRIRIQPAIPPAGSAGGDELARLELARFEAQVRRDTAALRDLLDEDLVYIHSNALIESKAHFIASVAQGIIRYDSLVPTEMHHRVYGTTAVGNGRVRVQVELNGQLVRIELLFTTVHVRRQGRWRLVNWQSTRVP